MTMPALPTPAAPSPAVAPRPALGRRLTGVDAARGLAVLGMFAAHVGNEGHKSQQPVPWEWLWVFHGRSAATFALLAGVSMILLDKRSPSLASSRIRIATRAVVLFVVGLVLTSLGTPVVIILVNMAAFMLLGMWLLRAPTRWLMGAAAFVAVAGPFLWRTVAESGGAVPQAWFLTDVSMATFGRFYPALAWLAYVFAGMAVARCDLSSRRVLARVAAIGAACTAAGYGVGAALGGGRISDLDFQWVPEWNAVQQHTNTSFEIVGNIGVSLLVLAGLCALVTWRDDIIRPLSAVGAAAFSAYVAHIIVIKLAAEAGNDLVYGARNSVLVAFWAISMLGATWWLGIFRRGPLEWIMHAASSGVARVASRKSAVGQNQ